MPTLLGLIVREAGKTLEAAQGDVREATCMHACARVYAWSIHLGHSPPSHRNGQGRKNLQAPSHHLWPALVRQGHRWTTFARSVDD